VLFILRNPCLKADKLGEANRNIGRSSSLLKEAPQNQVLACCRQ
jgi:hypothetical protein